MLLFRQIAGIYQETSSHTTRQGTLGCSRLSSLSHFGIHPGLKSGICVRELIYTKRGKKAQAGNELSNILPKSRRTRKNPLLLYLNYFHVTVCVGGWVGG